MHYNSRYWYKIARQKALEKQNMRCKYCLTPLTVNTATSDHKHPKSKGGADQQDNIVAACLPCNSLKSDMPARKFNKLIRKPPRGEKHSVAFLLANMRLRLSMKTLKACEQIKATAR